MIFKGRGADILLFVTSLLISLLLWIQLVPYFEPNKEREFDVDLLLENRPENLIVMSAPEKFRIVASGTVEQIDNLDTTQVIAVVDLEGARAGDGSFLVSIQGPPNSSLSFIGRRNRVEIILEPVVTSEKQIDLLPSGVTSANYIYDGASIVPESVTIRGPEMYVPRVASARVVLDLSRVRPGEVFSLPVELLDDQGRPVAYVTSDPSSVTVNPAVGIADARKRVLIQPNWQGQLAFGYEVADYTIEPTQVQITGASEEVAKVRTIQTEPIDLSNLNESRTFRVRLIVPADIRLEGAAEIEVRVTVRETG